MTRSIRPSLLLRLEQQLDVLADSVLRRMQKAHEDNPLEESSQSLPTIRAVLRAFFTAALEGHPPEIRELQAVSRVGEGGGGGPIPLPDLFAASQQGGSVLWDAAIASANDDEQPELLDLAGRLVTWQGLLARAATDAVLDERPDLDHSTITARRLLLDALTPTAPTNRVRVSQPPPELLDRAGVRLPETVTVIAFEPTTARNEALPYQALQSALDELAGETVLAAIDIDCGVALFPAEVANTPDSIAQVVAGLGNAVGLQLRAGIATATGVAQLSGAATEARALLALASTLALPSGAYSQDRLLLEYALSARDDSLERLAALLHPLERRPNLLATLESWFAHDFERTPTADALAVHRNTLDYRLRRIMDITGLALDSSRGLQLAGAALLARRLRAKG